MSTLSDAYCAGFFDGEGCVSLCYTVRRVAKSTDTPIMGFRMIVQLANTNHAILKKIKIEHAGNISIVRRSTEEQTRWKPSWSWRVTSGDDQRRFLTRIRPFTIVKSNVIDIALRYLITVRGPGYRPSQEDWDIRLDAYRQLRDLNSKGMARFDPKHEPPTSPPDGWNARHRWTPQEIARITAMMRSHRGRAGKFTGHTARGPSAARTSH